MGRWVLWEGRKAKTKGIGRNAKDAGHRTVAIRQIAVSLKLLLFLQNNNGNSFIRKIFVRSEHLQDLGPRPMLLYFACSPPFFPIRRL